jgi:hypothetical protein
MGSGARKSPATMAGLFGEQDLLLTLVYVENFH